MECDRSEIGVDAAGKKEEENDRGREGKRQGRERILQAVGCQKQAVWAKNSIFLAKFRQKIKKHLHNCRIFRNFVVAIYLGVRLHAGTRTYSEKTVSKSITNRDTGRLETKRITKKPKTKTTSKVKSKATSKTKTKVKSKGKTNSKIQFLMFLKIQEVILQQFHL